MHTKNGRWMSVLATLALAHGIGAHPACAQDAEKGRSTPATTSSGARPEFGILQGRWVRPDGGYVITIRSADAAGKLEASYANPSPLPFAKAQAARSDATLTVFFELQAGGYNGSTYTLTYDPAKDILRGVYYQAVARQRFDVYFVRAR
jgi:hypothetical protein